MRNIYSFPPRMQCLLNAAIFLKVLSLRAMQSDPLFKHITFSPTVVRSYTHAGGHRLVWWSECPQLCPSFVCFQHFLLSITSERSRNLSSCCLALFSCSSPLVLTTPKQFCPTHNHEWAILLLYFATTPCSSMQKRIAGLSTPHLASCHMPTTKQDKTNKNMQKENTT